MTNHKFHVAIIMDGNGRWALRRGLPRTAGHRVGGKVVRSIITAAARQNIDVLTLYAFSSDNWTRPAPEVRTLMSLFERYLEREADRCVENGIRINVIGRRDRLEGRLIRSIERVEALTSRGQQLQLRLAVDYSSRAAIIRAAQNLPMNGGCSHEAFSQSLNRAMHASPMTPDVDLLIRTGGEQRLSDFLLWECAYAELVFSDRYWPDFTTNDLTDALVQFQSRQRRYGGVPAQRSQHSMQYQG